MNAILQTELQQAIDKLNQGRVLVVGDLAIDEMVYGHTERLSREAPVVILRHQKTDIILGAAGNAAHNIAKLGASRASIVGVSGKDYYSSLLMEALERDGVETTGIVFDDTRPTTTKTRISGTANQSVTQQIVRIDRESQVPVAPDIESQLIDKLRVMAPEFDAILISDYGLGVVTENVIDCCLALTEKHNLLLGVDSQKSLTRFPGASILTPNQPEAEQNIGYSLDTLEKLLAGGQSLLKDSQAENLLITRGQDGMMLFERERQTYTSIPAFNRAEVFDVTGAGDTVVGTLILSLAAKVDILHASILGNLAASIVVKRFGASTTNPEELSQALKQLSSELLATIERRPMACSLR